MRFPVSWPVCLSGMPGRFRPRNGAILAFVLVLFLHGRASPQAQWMPTHGPYGGQIWSLLASDSLLLAGTDGGSVFLSADSGASWHFSGNGLPVATVTCLASSTDPSGLIRFFAGTYGQGLFRSDDKGATWTPSGTGFGSVFVRALAVDYDASGNPVIYLGAHNIGAFRSVDNGQSWTGISAGLGNPHVFSLAANDSFVMAGTGDGVYRMAKGAGAWAAAGMTGLFIPALAAASDGAGGTAWLAGTPVTIGVPTPGVYRSSDDGNTWTLFNTGLPYPNPTHFAVHDTDIFSGQYTGVYRTTSTGTSWTPLSTTFNVRAVALSENGPGSLIVYAGNDDNSGVFKTYDNGTTWLKANTDLAATSVSSLAAIPSVGPAPALLIAGMRGEGGGAQRSTDYGDTWTETGLNQSDLWSLQVMPGPGGGMILFAGCDWITYRSLDSGLTWYIMLYEPMLDALTLPNASGGLDLLMVTPSGIFSSSTYGTNLTPLGTGLGGLITRDLARIDSALFVGTDAGVYTSPDSGMTWFATGSGMTNNDVWDLEVIGQDLFAGTAAGVFRSSSLGAGWVPVAAGIGSPYITDLEPAANVLFAATFGGVFKSDDLGNSWTAFNAGLPAIGVASLAFVDSTLFACTYGFGLWKCPLNGIVSSSEPAASGLPDPPALEVIPNPSPGNFRIMYALPQRQPGQLQLFDISGTVIFQMALPQWSTLQQINLPETVSDGIYQVVITSGEYRAARKVAVFRRD